MIKFGFKTREAGMRYGEIKDLWLEAERLGFDSAWLYDHLAFRNCLESWTALSALAEATTRIRFGVMVTCNSFRYPSILAKMASTVDTISSGRLEFAIGAGDDQKEHKMFGIPFPEASERIEKLSEAIRIIKAMWTQPEAFFQGKYYALRGAILEPKPVQKPHPPIWIGGLGEKLMLRLVAEHANCWNAPQYLDPAWGNTPEDFARKREVLKRHCKAVGRDESEIVKCWQGEVVIAQNNHDVKGKLREAVERELPAIERKQVSVEEYEGGRIVGTPEQCVEKILRYADVGVTYFLTNFPERTFEPMRLFADKVVPLVRGK